MDEPRWTASADLPKPLTLAAEHMAGYRHEWYICGGWAVDLLLGRQTRDHLDVDIAVFEGDQHALHSHLAGWQLLGHDDAVADDCPDQWDGRWLKPPGHVHANTSTMAGTELDIQICPRAGDDWVLLTGASEPSFNLAMTECRGDNRWGELPVVSALIVLYFKALAPRWRMGSRAAPRPQDEADLEALLPTLDQTQRHWLRDAIAANEPDHPWLTKLWTGPSLTRKC